MALFIRLAWVSIITIVAASNQQVAWEAIVINLDRRPDRLQRFAKALNASAPWMFARGQVCRLHGRDGLKLLEVEGPQLPSLTRWSSSKSFLKNSAVRGALANALSDPIPRDPLKEEELINDGWLASEASTTVHSKGTVWPKMTAGGVGLYLSHAEAWRYVMDKGLDFGVIFEDDAVIYSPRFANELSRIVEGRQKWEWDFLYLQLDVESWPKNRPCPYKSSRPSQELPTAGLIPNTGAYIVTRQGAAKLLKGAFPAKLQLDAQLGKVPELKRARLDPIVVQCDERTQVADHWYRDTDTQHGHRSKEFNDLLRDVKDLSQLVSAASSQIQGPSSTLGTTVVPDCD